MRIERPLDRLGAGHRAGHVDREECGVEPAFAHAAADRRGSRPAPGRTCRDHEVPARLAEHQRRVDVGVDDDRLAMDARRAGFGCFRRRRRPPRARGRLRGQPGGERQSDQGSGKAAGAHAGNITTAAAAEGRSGIPPIRELDFQIRSERIVTNGERLSDKSTLGDYSLAIQAALVI